MKNFKNNLIDLSQKELINIHGGTKTLKDIVFSKDSSTTEATINLGTTFFVYNRMSKSNHPIIANLLIAKSIINTFSNLIKNL